MNCYLLGRKWFPSPRLRDGLGWLGSSAPGSPETVAPVMELGPVGRLAPGSPETVAPVMELGPPGRLAPGSPETVAPAMELGPPGRLAPGSLETVAPAMEVGSRRSAAETCRHQAQRRTPSGRLSYLVQPSLYRYRYHPHHRL